MHPRTPTVLRCLATTDAVADADLLSRFVMNRDQAAFELLVWRHSGMVLRVCRAVLGEHHAAEDACQATFLALARQADSVRRGEVAGWLFRVARRISLRAVTKRSRARVGSHELLEAVPAPNPPEQDATLIRVLHEEVAGLPERYRLPVLLCFFSGLTHRAAADRLGMPVGTLATRVARARDRLQRRLVARGFGASAGVLTATLTSGLATATADFVSATARSAVAFGAGIVPDVPENVLELAKGATRPMTKIRLAASALAVCGATALCGMWVAGSAEPLKPPESLTKEAPAAAGEPRLAFNIVGLDANDLADAFGLNVYKFKIEIPKGQKFDIVLREMDDKDAHPRELKRFRFEKDRKAGATMVRVDFTREDGAAGNVLLSNQKECVLRVNCTDCTPGGMVSFVPVPLAGVKLTEKTLMVHKSDQGHKLSELKDPRLLSIISSVVGKPAPEVDSFPRAELVIEKR